MDNESISKIVNGIVWTAAIIFVNMILTIFIVLYIMEFLFWLYIF
jgi:hypothetical protein